jgi:hypothetical protein
MTMKRQTKPPTLDSIPAFINKKDIPEGTSYTPLPTCAEIHSQWLAKAKKSKQDNGSNSHLNDFLTVINRIRATQKSFCPSEVVKMCRNFEMEIQEIHRLWLSYKEYAIQHCILEEVAGCYEESTFFGTRFHG